MSTSKRQQRFSPEVRVRISVDADPSFRSRAITHFAPSPSPISEEADQPFRSKPITHFGRRRSPGNRLVT